MQNIELEYPGYIFRKQFDDEIIKSKKAIVDNPADVDSLTKLAHAYINLWCYGFIPHSEAIPNATDAALKALEIDNKSALAHVALGLIKESLWEWGEIENELKLGIELSPYDALAYNWYANYLYATSRFDEAYVMANMAIKFSDDPGYKIGLGAISYFRQDFERLKKEMLDLIAYYPNYAPAYDWLGMAYIQLQEFDNSIEAYEKATSLSGGLAEILGGLGHAYGMAGNEKEAKRVLDKMNDYSPKIYIPPVQIAFIYAGLNDVDNTLRLLERAYSEKSWELIFMRTEPWFQHLHSDPRFESIINRMKFPMSS